MSANRPDSDVIRAADLRRLLNSMQKQRFYRMVHAGRFSHLEATGPSSVLGYTVYSRRKVTAWIDNQPFEPAEPKRVGRATLQRRRSHVGDRPTSSTSTVMTQFGNSGAAR